MSTLDAWLEGQFVGQFREAEDRTVTFVYDEDAPATPISLSIPREKPATKKAAKNFLDNVLPDHDATRAQMARTYGATSTSTFDLLAKGGGDVAGGLVLLPEGSEFIGAIPLLDVADDIDIADRIAAIKRDPDAWVPRDTLARFSLGGTQGKFALASVDGVWHWSNASVPSTHILKPARPDLRGLEAVEAASLRLARTVGLSAPEASVFTAEDQSSYMVERFDRLPGELFATRLHVEDFAQASGIHPDRKYDLTAAQALQLLAPEDTDYKLAYAFVEQLAFNTLLGNADAHAKNYSIILRPSGIELSPMYDLLPIGIYPVDQELAMDISGAKRSAAVETHHWRKFATRAGLDPDEVLTRVTGIAEGIAENVDTAWTEVDADQQKLIREQLLRNTDKILSPARRPTLPPPETKSGSHLTRNMDHGLTEDRGRFAPPIAPEP